MFDFRQFIGKRHVLNAPALAVDLLNVPVRSVESKAGEAFALGRREGRNPFLILGFVVPLLPCPVGQADFVSVENVLVFHGQKIERY